MHYLPLQYSIIQECHCLKPRKFGDLYNFLNGWKTQGGVCAVRPILPACVFYRAQTASK